MAITLSPEHGLNPAVPKCFFCQQNKNELILAGRMPGDREAPMGAVWDMRPCHECEEIMKAGVILISIKEGELEQVNKEHREWKDRNLYLPPEKRKPFIPNPYRTGGWTAMRDDAVLRIFPHYIEGQDEEAKKKTVEASMIRPRWAFVPDSVWDHIPLPRGKQNMPEGTPTSFEEFKKAQAEQAAQPKEDQGAQGESQGG